MGQCNYCSMKQIRRDYYEAALQRIKRETAQMTLIDAPNTRITDSGKV